MRELGIFVDESGSDGLSDRHYLLTVVMHDQSESIAELQSYDIVKGPSRERKTKQCGFEEPAAAVNRSLLVQAENGERDLAPSCKWGIAWSSASKNSTPAQKPTNTGTKKRLPKSAECSIAGMIRIHADAATITPAAKPASERCTKSPSERFMKSTHAALSVVLIKGMRIPKKASIAPSFLARVFSTALLRRPAPCSRTPHRQSDAYKLS